MAYQKQTWRDYDDNKTEVVNMNQGAVVTPERLNHMETGIANSADKAEVTAQLQQKVGNGKLASMADLGQDIKTAMTGGSVAVVGENAVLTENIVDKQVTPKKTSFIENVSESIFTVNKEETSTASGHTISIRDGLIRLNGVGGGASVSNVTVDDITALPFGTYTISLKVVSETHEYFRINYKGDSGDYTELLSLSGLSRQSTITITDSIQSLRVYLQPNYSYSNCEVLMWIDEGTVAKEYESSEVYKLMDVGVEKDNIGEKSVTPEKTSFIENVSKNIFTANTKEISTASGHTLSITDGLIRLNGSGGGDTASNVTVEDMTTLPFGTYTISLKAVSDTHDYFRIDYKGDSGGYTPLLALSGLYKDSTVTITDSIQSLRVRLQSKESFSNCEVLMWINEGTSARGYEPTVVYKLVGVGVETDSEPSTSNGEIVDSAGNTLTDLFTINNLRMAQETDSTKQYSYTGEKINLTDYKNNTYHYDISFLLELEGIGSHVHEGRTLSAQSFAIHNDICFIFYDTGYCKTVDLINKTLISGFWLPESPKDANHAGQATFGVEYVEGNTEFPALYLSSYLEGLCHVYSITTTGAVRVQKLRVPDGEAWFLDKEFDKMIVKIGGVRSDGITKYKYYKVFDIPALSDGADITYTDDYACDSFYIRTTKGSTGLNYPTAGFARHGKIYVPAFGNKLFVYDYLNHVILTEIFYSDPKMTAHEREQVHLYNGKLVFNFNGGDYLVQMDFD